jgi:dUTP pyrophosphatase
MKLKLFDKNVTLPKKQHLPDSGLDIFMPVDLEIDMLETKTIGLGIGIAIPEGHAGMLVPRSSIADKGLLIQTAVIDPDYSGEIHLIVTNCSRNKIEIKTGDRVCSLIVYNVLNPYIQVVEELPNSERGTKGLGSSGR